jgi:hypothetical protein
METRKSDLKGEIKFDGVVGKANLRDYQNGRDLSLIVWSDFGSATVFDVVEVQVRLRIKPTEPSGETKRK